MQNPAPNSEPLPSFENPQDEDAGTPDDPNINAADNVYHVTVVATDNHGKAAEYAVTITVTDKEETGAIAVSLPNDPPQVGDELTFTLSDPDGGIDDSPGAIDWTIEARRPAEGMDPAGPWVEVDDSDNDLDTLDKTYTIDEDDTGQEIRATATYTDGRGSGKMAESAPTAAVVDQRVVAPPRFRSGATADHRGRPRRQGHRCGDNRHRQGWRGPHLGYQRRENTPFDYSRSSRSNETITVTVQENEYTEYTAQLADHPGPGLRGPACKPAHHYHHPQRRKGHRWRRHAIYDDIVDVEYRGNHHRNQRR